MHGQQNIKKCKVSPYRAVNTLLLGYKNQSVNTVQGINRCLFSDPHKTHKYTAWAERRFAELNLAVHNSDRWYTPFSHSKTHSVHQSAIVFHMVLIINCINRLVSIMKALRVFYEVGFELLNVIYMSSMLWKDKSRPLIAASTWQETKRRFAVTCSSHSLKLTHTLTSQHASTWPLIISSNVYAFCFSRMENLYRD
jgi:hypothetical protein